MSPPRRPFTVQFVAADSVRDATGVAALFARAIYTRQIRESGVLTGRELAIGADGPHTLNQRVPRSSWQTSLVVTTAHQSDD